MKKRDLANLRMQNQGLAHPRCATPEEAVSWLGAVQAQEYAFAKWSLGQRVPGNTEPDVTAAIADGRIIRTHALRPTWHFLAAEDARWILKLTSPRVKAFIAYYDRLQELDSKLIGRAKQVLATTLAGGNRRVRKDLTAVLAEAGIAGTGQRIGHVLMHAELDAVICSGGMIGKQHAYALFDDVIPPRPTLEADEALAELTRRYFRSHGPATVQDYRWWSSLTIAEVRRGVAMCAPDIESVEVDGTTYWYIGSREATPEPSPAVHLLQGYDEYFVGHTGDRSVINEAGLVDTLLNRPAFTHALVVDTQVVGHWRRVAAPKAMTVEVQALRQLSKAEHAALENEVQRYGKFVGLPASLQVIEA
jgi:hypothetical protein